MAGLSIFWTETAYLQRNLIFQYWNERNQSNTYSKKLSEEIKKRINYISLFPQIGKKVNYPETRAVSLGHYSIFYKIMGDNIVITSFWDNRDDPDKLLQVLQKT